MNAIQDFLKNNAATMSDQTIERLLLVSMLHEAMQRDPNYLPPIPPTDAKEAMHHIREVIKVPRNALQDDTLLYKGEPTTVGQLAERLVKAEYDARQFAGWRVPKIGDKLRVVKLPQDEGFYETKMKIGDVGEVTSAAALCKSAISQDPNNLWPSFPSVSMKPINGESLSEIIPLCCLEPITE